MAVGPEIESIRYDDLPSPEQVGRLATRLVEFAQRHDNLSTYGGNSPDDSLKYVVKPVQYFEASSLDIPDVYLLQIRTGAHVEDYPDGARRLRVFDSLIRKEFGLPGGLGVRSIYDFAWTESQTICTMSLSLDIRKMQADQYGLKSVMIHDETVEFVRTG